MTHDLVKATSESDWHDYHLLRRELAGIAFGSAQMSKRISASACR
jgi:hypothetical protein